MTPIWEIALRAHGNFRLGTRFELTFQRSIPFWNIFFLSYQVLKIPPYLPCFPDFRGRRCSIYACTGIIVLALLSFDKRGFY